MADSSHLAHCYQILGLTSHATELQIKEAYRKLAKRYHPDLNPGNQQAADQFVRVKQAYETLIAALAQQSKPPSDPAMRSTATSTQPHVKVSVKKRSQPPPPPPLSPEQEQIKQRVLYQLRELLKQRQWQRAIKHAEDLAQRLPHQPDISQLQAKAYHGWARELIDRRRYDEARPYLQKAMKADSTNRWLWQEIERDYIRIERGLKL